MNTLYLDMDGVLSDFNSKWQEILPDLPDKQRFAQAVMEYKIFSTLKPMPDALELLEYVATLRNIHIEVLTSVGTFDETRGYEAKMQKRGWLDRNNIPFTVNFVRCKEEKANFATKTSILIDDSEGCVTPFNAAGGYGILHVSTKETIPQIKAALQEIERVKKYTS